MITKDQLAHGMLRECDICIHLASKFDEAGLAYRPTPGQRSTLELMQYLSFAPGDALGFLRDGDWHRFGDAAKAATSVTAGEFPAAMERQKAKILAFFDGVTEEQLDTHQATLPGGRGHAPLGEAILNGPFIWLPAYKMQLFLYAKSTGGHHLGTSNVWRGIDAPAP